MPDLYHIFVLMITCFILCYLSVFVNIGECDLMCMCVHVENINTNVNTNIIYSMSKISENINTNIMCSMSEIFEISFKITDFLL